MSISKSNDKCIRQIIQKTKTKTNKKINKCMKNLFNTSIMINGNTSGYCEVVNLR